MDETQSATSTVKTQPQQEWESSGKAKEKNNWQYELPPALPLEGKIPGIKLPMSRYQQSDI